MIHGGNNLHVHLCQLFNSMLIHGMSPSSLQSSTLVPIPKDKRKSLSLSDNYRAIALSSPISPWARQEFGTTQRDKGSYVFFDRSVYVDNVMR